MRGEDDDGSQGLVSTHCFEDGPTIGVRELYVEQYEIRPVRVRNFESLFARGGFQHLVTRWFEHEANEHSQIGFIVDDEYLRGHGAIGRTSCDAGLGPSSVTRTPRPLIRRSEDDAASANAQLDRSSTQPYVV